MVLGYVHSMKRTVTLCLFIIISVFSIAVNCFIQNNTGKNSNQSKGLRENIYSFEGLDVGGANKVIYENNYSVDSGIVGATDEVEIVDTKVIVTVLLDYDRKASTMFKEGNTTPSILNSKEYENIIDSIYVPDHEEYYKNYHTLKNREIISNLKIGDYEEMYISTLTPFVEYTFSLWQFEKNKDSIISTLREFDKISRIHVTYTDETFKDDIGGIMMIAEAEIDNYTGEYTGDGITVGILENGIIDVDHVNMEGIDITVHNQLLFNEEASVHATQMASLIGGNRGIAPDVSFLTSQIRGGISEELDWLVENGADIINLSFSDETPNGNYSINSAYVDYLARVYNQIFIVSAGNVVNGTNYYVGNPGLAYNAATIGAIDYEREWCDFSCYQSNGPTKPTVMVKGFSTAIFNMAAYGVPDGTSYSAAGTTGMMAMLLEKYPALINKPQKAISLMCANAKRTSGLYYYDENNNFDEFMGAGEFNYTRIKNNYANSVDIVNSIDAASGIIYRYEFTLDAGETMQAAIAWLTYADDTDANCETTDYDIKLIYNNLVISYGCSLVDNVEMVNFTAEYDNSECAILIIQTSERAMQTETVSFSYNIS